MSWLHGVAARWRLMFSSRASEARIDAELEFHIDMETERLIRELGLDPAEARRRALAAFGGVEAHRETLRHARDTAWIGALSLDATLGLRMLIKYPALTIIGVLGVSIAVAVGTLAFIAAAALNSSTLPLDDGERVVAITNRNVQRSVDAKATHLHSFPIWREAMRTVDDLAAFRLAHRNVITAGHGSASMFVAEMSASAFRLARVSPSLGRTFTDDDEREGGPDVAVIGNEAWQRLFDGRADVVGSIVQLGATPHTVIGVMPPGFAFPINNQIWTPLRLRALAYRPGEAPPINVLGRLTSRSSLDDAQRELMTLASRVREATAATSDSIRPFVVPYTRTFFTGTVAGMGLGSLAQRAQVIVILLMIVITTHLAVLIYARTASRASEMAVRTALGASRPRIVAQLFVEALVLSGVASMVGLAIASVASRRVATMVRMALGESLPYWIRLEVTPGVALYVAGLAIFAAVIIGAIPALKATRHHVAQSLKDVSGNASIRLGRTWTALFVAEVAVSVAVLPIALGGSQAWLSLAFLDLASPTTSRTVITEPRLDDDPATYPVSPATRLERRARYATSMLDLERRLESEANVGAALMRSMPSKENGMWVELEPDSVSAPDTLVPAGHSVLENRVRGDFFRLFDIRLLGGRTFDDTDLQPGTSGVVVNRAFTQRFYAGSNALGRRIRPFEARNVDGGRQEPHQPWWEIIGIVDDFPTIATHTNLPRIYLPLRSGEIFPITLAVRAPALPVATTADRVRTVALSVDPALRFGSIRSLEDLLERGIEAERLGILVIVMIMVSVVLLSAAGIYALMSFTVARRRREIGIRAALGAGRGRVLVGILSRAMWQIGIGVAIGVVGAPVIATLAGDTSTTKELLVNALALIASMFVVGLLATVGPARRALQVHPTEALRAE